MEPNQYVDRVLDKCETLVATDLWPRVPKIRPRAWIANFSTPEEKAAAALLLDNFVFYSSRAADRLLVGAFETVRRTNPASKRSIPRDILDTAVFTLVSGQTVNATDSGYHIVRRARQLLGIAEDRFMGSSEALDAAKVGRPVIFLDDFAGTGDQFITAWRNPKVHPNAPAPSFEAAYAASAFYAGYVNIFSTLDAGANIHRETPVVMQSAHQIDAAHVYTGLHLRQPTPHLSDPVLRVNALLSKYSTRLQFRPEDAYMNHDDYPRLGYKNLGLMVAMEDSVPDGTLPIYWASGPGSWTSLVDRT